MGDLMNARRKLLFLILFFLVLFAFADTGSAWIGWVGFASIANFRCHCPVGRTARLFAYLRRLMQATIISMLVVLMIIDFMFLDDTYFTFDPDYKNYARKTTPVY